MPVPTEVLDEDAKAERQRRLEILEAEHRQRLEYARIEHQRPMEVIEAEARLVDERRRRLVGGFATAPEWDGLADDQGPIPTFGPARTDERGRIVMGQGEREARREASIRALGAIGRITDETERGTPEWRGWLERFASKRRVTPTELLDLAVAELAQQDGFETPPPRF